MLLNNPIIFNDPLGDGPYANFWDQLWARSGSGKGNQIYSSQNSGDGQCEGIGNFVFATESTWLPSFNTANRLYKTSGYQYMKEANDF